MICCIHCIITPILIIATIIVAIKSTKCENSGSCKTSKTEDKGIFEEIDAEINAWCIVFIVSTVIAVIATIMVAIC